ncbi:A/G-specific adenine glycosylase [Roseibium aggregatum]|uniref:Adenine DNA glycosylase n=1 Tax=Roseibium aggregatum TaxID=187304 RepID=A0A939EA50_9HYPH|nr:A/G-specific adenine glycosylase [Roseibium aggregatum]MBN9669153.1 A/G-specific adenine glycosylase [Roseibium aggregatum]
MYPTEASDLLLSWYERYARRLPWRVAPEDRKLGEIPDPYKVWLSEVMLQQTTVAAVKDYFRKFTETWPTVEDLAAAHEEDVMKAWAGLGYYSRARNLKKCAMEVARSYGGRFPEDETELLKLPGIGPYTAAAISTIAFDRHAAVVDGNVERVLARYARIETPLPEAKPAIKSLMGQLTPEARPGDFAQAVMDLGATICTPRRPACALCPWTGDCRARAANLAESLPQKAPKKQKPTRFGAAFVAVDETTGAVLLRRRPPKGLLGGMTEVPGTNWSEDFDADTALAGVPFPAPWQPRPAQVTHTFTHFHLRLTVFRAAVSAPTEAALDGAWWSSPETLEGEALPTVMRKVLAAALD